MKRLTNILFLALVLASSFVFAQKAQPTTVSETSETIQGVYGDALHVKIHRASQKEIVKALKSEWKDNNGEVETKRNEIIASGVNIPSIGSEGVKMLARVREFSKLEHELLIIFLDGDLALSPENSSFYNAKAYLYELANKISKSSNINYHEKEEKNLRQLEGEFKDIAVRLEKDAEKIKKLEKTKEKEQKKIDSIDKQKNLDQKSIELRKKAVEKVIKSREKINDLEYDITINKKNEKEKKDEIKAQKEIVENAKKDRAVFE